MALGNEVIWDAAPLYTQSDSYSAQDDRRSTGDFQAPGVLDNSSARVTWSGAGMGLTINAGTFYVRAVNSDGGVFRCRSTANQSLTIAASDPTYPRLDQVVALVYDNTYDAQGLDTCKISIVTPGNGSSNSGATLDTRTNAVNLDTGLTGAKHYLLLADVLVGNGVSSLSSSVIRDRRQYALRGQVPGLLTNPLRTSVTFEPHPASHRMTANVDYSYASRQSCALMYLPAPIAANHLTWRYQNGHSGIIGTGQSYRMVICDASGRIFTNSAGAEANWLSSFTGGSADGICIQDINMGATFQFWPGWYRIWWGLSALVGDATNSIRFPGVSCDGNGGTTTPGTPGSLPLVADVCYGKTTGGTTFGDAGSNTKTILYMTDTITSSGTSQFYPPVPIPTLYV